MIRFMNHTHKNGFTLFEVMISSAVAMILIMGVYSAMLVFVNMIVTTRSHNEAEALAMDRIWAVFNQDYDSLRIFTPNPRVETLPATSFLYPMGGTMRTAVLVESNACEIQVAVDWRPMTFSGRSIPSQELLTIRRSPARR